MNIGTGALLAYHSKSAVVQNVNADKIEIRLDGGSVKSVRTKAGISSYLKSKSVRWKFVKP